VPDSKKEQVIEILKGYLCDDEGVPEIADAIDQIYKEATV
jgi:aerobic-type carbon monoxide dehydrogenase small subunit (CoxS/CutS family)